MRETDNLTSLILETPTQRPEAWRIMQSHDILRKIDRCCQRQGVHLKRNWYLIKTMLTPCKSDSPHRPIHNGIRKHYYKTIPGSLGISSKVFERKNSIRILVVFRIPQFGRHSGCRLQYRCQLRRRLPFPTRV